MTQQRPTLGLSEFERRVSCHACSVPALWEAKASVKRIVTSILRVLGSKPPEAWPPGPFEGQQFNASQLVVVCPAQFHLVWDMLKIVSTLFILMEYGVSRQHGPDSCDSREDLRCNQSTDQGPAHGGLVQPRLRLGTSIDAGAMRLAVDRVVLLRALISYSWRRSVELEKSKAGAFSTIRSMLLLALLCTTSFRRML